MGTFGADEQLAGRERHVTRDRRQAACRILPRVCSSSGLARHSIPNNVNIHGRSFPLAEFGKAFQQFLAAFAVPRLTMMTNEILYQFRIFRFVARQCGHHHILRFARTGHEIGGVAVVLAMMGVQCVRQGELWLVQNTKIELDLWMNE